jgi:threonyl-tRNA synthetase
MRLAEFGCCHRNEAHGALHGLLRVRQMTQDDAHIFCTEEQMIDEIIGVIDLATYMAGVFGYDFKAYLATRPDKWVGDEETWARATDALKLALEQKEVAYKLDEGGGAFYGPKIDIKWVDALGREWTGPTVQLDFNLPQRFDITYIGEDGERHRAVMIHRTLLGSMERFVGGLVEHYAGAFPVWLAPTQIALIPITDDQVAYCQDVMDKALAMDLRVELFDQKERMQAKIRDAQLMKIPYMLVVGKREVENGAVAVRLRSGEDLGAMAVDDFLAMAKEIVASKSLELTPKEA